MRVEGIVGGFEETYLLDEHVKVLWDLGSEAWEKSLCQSETKQRHNCVCSCALVGGS
jgi:hypothetical protein